MKTVTVTMARIYMNEHEGVHGLLKYLHDESKVCGVTVFRGISGFGRSGRTHSASLLDLSLDLPVVIEFFERPEKAAAILEHINTLIEPGHMVTWTAQVNVED